MGVAVRNEYFYYEAMGDTSFEEFMYFINLPDNLNGTFELIDGFIVMMAGNTSFNHQRISGFISSEIHHYLRGKKCEVVQDVNVYLFRENLGMCRNIFQPDIMIGCDKEKMTGRGYEGTPDFIVEVVSKSTARNDYLVKLNRYMEFGVKEYWIVDLDKNQILVCLNKKENTPIINKYTFNDEIKISIFDDFSIDFKEILKIVG